MTEEKPFGSWASPVTAANLTEGAIELADLRVFGQQLCWLETRPDEGGRQVVMTFDGTVKQLTSEGFNVRTRVHEYGGAPFVVATGGLWFSNFGDQRLYHQIGHNTPVAVTPPGYRYTDAVPAPGGGLIIVREDHTDPANIRNAVVRLPGHAGDAGEVLFGSSDFVAYPRLSPDGRRLAWIAWDFPAMPWDATRLYVADLSASGLENQRLIAGRPGVSVLEPLWAADGTLTWLSDESGFWNLYDDYGGKPRAILPRKAEFGGPPWLLGLSHYAVAGDRIVATAVQGGVESLLVIDRRDRTVRELDIPYSDLACLQTVDGGRVAAIGRNRTETSVIVTIDIVTAKTEVVRRPSRATLRRGDIALPEPISFPSARGRIAHALFYPPTNSAFRAPAGELPPLIVQAHGGPTGAASSAFNLGIQYWTSRGFAVVDVDYGGSSGYGRAYRDLLNGQWGVVDVEDVIAAAQHLAQAGRVDAKRIAIHGGSAGGFTVLAALARSDVFSAGTSYYGVADLGALARDTHKFERRYLDGLIGPWPEAKAIYDERSPINHLDGFTAPLLILQGSEDRVVPPNQAWMIRDALRARRVPVACIEFEGEGHGFRRAENIIRAKEAELYFYGKVFGFTPADDIDPVEIEYLQAGLSA